MKTYSLFMYILLKLQFVNLILNEYQVINHAPFTNNAHKNTINHRRSKAILHLIIFILFIY